MLIVTIIHSCARALCTYKYEYVLFTALYFPCSIIAARGVTFSDGNGTINYTDKMITPSVATHTAIAGCNLYIDDSLYKVCLK